MKSHIKLRLRAVEGALIRSLGTIERRGFRLSVLQTIRQTADSMELVLTVENEHRPIASLLKQLQRLHDVEQAQLLLNETCHLESSEPLGVIGSLQYQEISGLSVR